jgi:hypothetical protein
VAARRGDNPSDQEDNVTTTDQTATEAPPWSPPDDLYRIVAANQAARWGYVRTLDQDALARYIHDQADDSNLRADVDAVWLYAWQRVDQSERTSRQLAETAAQFNKRIAEKAEELAAPRIAEARHQVAEVMAELERVGEFHQQRLNDLRAEFQRQLNARDKQIERLIAAAKGEGTR